MNPEPTLEDLADAYVRYAANVWSQDFLADLIRRDPTEAWKVICRVVESAPGNDILAFVAAGPLEEFVVAHGEQFLEAISTYARSSPKMRWALGGVWQESRMPKRVWRQIQKLSDRTS